MLTPINLHHDIGKHLQDVLIDMEDTYVIKQILLEVNAFRIWAFSTDICVEFEKLRMLEPWDATEPDRYRIIK